MNTSRMFDTDIPESLALLRCVDIAARQSLSTTVSATTLLNQKKPIHDL